MSKSATVRARGQAGLKSDIEIGNPNRLTARTLRESKRGKNLKQFGSKKELYADLGNEKQVR